MVEFYRGRQVLVTGGVGFIGSNLALRLVELGARVVLVDSMLPAYGATLRNIEPIRGAVQLNFSDVRDRHSLGYLVRDQELIFSLAGQVSHSESMHDPWTDLEINCRSQLSLLEACRQGNPAVKLVFASTRQLYGRPRYLPVDERHPLEPADINGIHKLAAELYYTLYHRVYGMATVSLRLTNTYGPRMDLHSDKKGFVGIFVRRALAGQTVQIYGDGQQRRDFNYVDDAVEALLLAGANSATHGDVYNLGHPRPRTLLEFVQLLQRHARFDYELVPFPPDAERIDIGDYFGDAAKFRGVTGWEPKVDLEEGLERTLAYYRGRAGCP
ncbi:MAG TPA: NAD-dependent epimerase/dehydratase family protein [Candidatus Polarisedimenticolaceae bacterium]|nr:NAD-dependent epimerase/dehydratase family protein [Candidatus Polarisedimenticolaceae bacterium]